VSTVGFVRFGDFVTRVEKSLAVERLPKLSAPQREFLNGGTTNALVRTVHPTRRATLGAFFTPRQLARAATRRYRGVLQAGIRVHDPACGAGDLLLECARYLPVRSDVKETLALWGRLLSGYDIQPEFVRLTKLRLVLLAADRVKSLGPLALPKPLFPRIRVGSGRTGRFQADLVVLNPPYGLVVVDRSWRSGRVSEAAVFLEEVVRSMDDSTQLCAILPDALRAGSSYRAWRDQMMTMLEGQARSTVMRGQFSTDADIDVFTLNATRVRDATQRTLFGRRRHRGKTLEDVAEIHVGAVVPHRDRLRGSNRRYVTARTIRGKKLFYAARAPRRRFDGRVQDPPLVVVRRTSAPRDLARVGATLILGTEPIALENHLIALQPKTGGRKQATAIMNTLVSRKTRRFLNDAIRCRHLTVDAMRAIPWI
jgi:N-6 DNA methylase